MPERSDALGVGAQQDVDDMACAKALASPVHSRQPLLRRDPAVAALFGFKAAIAVVAGLGQLLTEMAEQHLTPAAAGFAVGDQGLELAAFDAFLLLTGSGVIDEPAQLGDVAGAVGHPGHRR